MRKEYKKSVTLKCATCGDTNFEFNENKTWLKCKRCEREYNGGYDELVNLNQAEIGEELEKTKKEVTADLKKDFEKMLKDAFKGNKNLKFK